MGMNGDATDGYAWVGSRGSFFIAITDQLIRLVMVGYVGVEVSGV